MNSRNDNLTTVAELKTAMAMFAKERDWEQFHAPKNLSMAIAAEAGELMEHFLWCTPEESTGLLSNPEMKTKIADELADIILFAAQFANMSGIDISTAVLSKVEKNAVKYPISKAKGRSDKYTSL